MKKITEKNHCFIFFIVCFFFLFFLCPLFLFLFFLIFSSVSSFHRFPHFFFTVFPHIPLFIFFCFLIFLSIFLIFHFSSFSIFDVFVPSSSLLVKMFHGAQGAAWVGPAMWRRACDSWSRAPPARDGLLAGASLSMEADKGRLPAPPGLGSVRTAR